MSVLVYTESEQGRFKKTAFEVASYGKAIADQLGTTVTALTINADDVSELETYGVNKVLKVKNVSLDAFNAKIYASVIQQAAEKEGTKVVVVSSSVNSKYLAPLLSINLNAGYATNVLEAPVSTSPFIVKRTAFTNKAYEMFQIKLPCLCKEPYRCGEKRPAYITDVSGDILTISNSCFSEDDANCCPSSEATSKYKFDGKPRL